MITVVVRSDVSISGIHVRVQNLESRHRRGTHVEYSVNMVVMVFTWVFGLDHCYP